MSSVIGVDLGGTKIAAARYDSETWQLQESERMETHADKSFDHVFTDMIGFIEKLKADDTTAVGVGVPGLVKQPDGIVLTMPNIPESENIQLKEKLSSRLGLDSFVDNDANCFVLAEAIKGAGMGHSVVVGVTLGTGVGGGIVIDKKIFHGSNGYAAEIGHMLLRPGEPPFETKDKRGDVEQFLSGTAMGNRCKQAERPEEYLSGDVCSFMHPDLYKEVAWLCVNLVHLLDPSIIVFGGSAGGALAPHMKEIEEELRNWILPGTPLPTLAQGALDNAATLGAALLTRY